MTKEEAVAKIREVIGRYSYLGRITDIWVHQTMLEIVDGRTIMERLSSPANIDGIYMTPSTEVGVSEIRVAFVTKYDIEETNETVSNVRRTPFRE